MTFGFSVGDILGSASLAYKLCKALSETKGSSTDYQQLIAELNIVHKVLLQVEELRVSNQLAQATLNALLFTTNSASEAMEVFLADHEKYGESLKRGGSGNMFKDGWRKGIWVFQVESEQKKLRQTLASMLVSINCLVQLACYFNTGYTPEVDAKLATKYEGRSHILLPQFNDVKLENCIRDTQFWRGEGPNFKTCHKPLRFFRSGQVFSLCIPTRFTVHHRSYRPVKLSQLPLEPIATLKAKQEQMQKYDREKRLIQILSLPLAEMISYAKEAKDGKVWCILCRENTGLHKDTWADMHFRLSHWKRYCEMRGISPKSNELPSIASYVPTIARVSISQPILPTDWISLKDITLDRPIQEDWEIKEMIGASIGHEPHVCGPTMIRRFVVIREGVKSCLCLGIHTYSGLGCSTQEDQDLFAILHSSKEVPTPFEKETGMVLPPIRMKPEHPSTALPTSSRIHFGRAYEVSHELPVKPLGLIHAGSMQDLISESEAHVYKNESGNNPQPSETPDVEVAKEPMDLDKDISPADMELVRSMRCSIMDVLGDNISLDRHPPPAEPVLGIDTVLKDFIDRESSLERKRARIN